jgi:hypothetical protein
MREKVLTLNSLRVRDLTLVAKESSHS